MSDSDDFVELFKEEALFLEKEFNYCQSLACLTEELVRRMGNVLKLLKLTHTTQIIPRKMWELVFRFYERVSYFTKNMVGQTRTAQYN
jgi:hypothetical protein